MSNRRRAERIRATKIFFENYKDYYRRHKAMPTGCVINGVNIAFRGYRGSKDFYFDETSIVIRVKPIVTEHDYGLAIINYNRFKEVMFF